MRNKYYWHSRISEKKFKRVVKCFIEEKTALQTFSEVNLTQKTINNLFGRFRQIIASECNRKNLIKEEIFLKNRVDIVKKEDKSITSEKIKKEWCLLEIWFENEVLQLECVVFNDFEYLDVFGIYFESEIREISPQKVISFKMEPFCTISQATFGVKNFNHNEKEYLIMIYYYCHFIKNKLEKYRGIRAEKLHLYIKEQEWRFNNRNSDLYQKLLELLRNNPV
jgi:transposase